MSRKKTQERKEKFKRAIIFEIYGFAILAFAIIGLIQPGAVGQALKGVFRFFAGSFDFLIPLAILVLGCYVIWKRRWPEKWTQRWSGALLLTITWLLFVHISLISQATAHGIFDQQGIISFTYQQYVNDLATPTPEALGGGMIGALLYTMFHFLLAETGTKIVVLFLFLISLMLLSGRSYYDLWTGLIALNGRFIKWLKERRANYKQMMQELKEEEEQKKQLAAQTAAVANEASITETTKQAEGNESSTPELLPASKEQQELNIHDFADVVYHIEDHNQEDHTTTSTEKPPTGQNIDMQAAQDDVRALGSDTSSQPLTISAKEMVMFEEENLDYGLPPFSILKKPSSVVVGGKKNLQSNAAKLEQTLQSFGVQARVTDVHRGPAVTRYEILPDVGVKVSRIVSLTDDIALALAAKGIRIEAPIPGKSAIGIEVPNDDVAMVSLREVLESSQYHESPSKLTIGLGRDISGQPIVAHLNKMPHLLVAGATGSGKSVCINGIITSILYKAKPNEVKLMMIDPKMVELNVYNGIPHLLTPVVTDPRKAAVALKKVVSEMERRYELFAHLGTRDIERYNEIVKRENLQSPEDKKPLLPYIVVIVDELADLMMVAPGDVEDAICRLAQMARAAGIHLIIATQRPSVDVITGVIKANIPSRIAFGVSSQADSRTILDMGGAEKLLGRGDMLFLPVGASKPMRVQGAFVADEEVESVVKYCIDQQRAQYHEEMNPESPVEQQVEHHEEDELYQQAVELVVQQGSASVSMLQRRFRIGYARAARLIDSMELNGVVGPYEGSKPREVLIEKEEHIS